jgi:hypothetical protein
MALTGDRATSQAFGHDRTQVRSGEFAFGNGAINGAWLLANALQNERIDVVFSSTSADVSSLRGAHPRLRALRCDPHRMSSHEFSERPWLTH